MGKGCFSYRFLFYVGYSTGWYICFHISGYVYKEKVIKSRVTNKIIFGNIETKLTTVYYAI